MCFLNCSSLSTFCSPTKKSCCLRRVWVLLLTMLYLSKRSSLVRSLSLTTLELGTDLFLYEAIHWDSHQKGGPPANGLLKQSMNWILLFYSGIQDRRGCRCFCDCIWSRREITKEYPEMLTGSAELALTQIMSAVAGTVCGDIVLVYVKIKNTVRPSCSMKRISFPLKRLPFRKLLMIDHR